MPNEITAVPGKASEKVSFWREFQEKPSF